VLSGWKIFGLTIFDTFDFVTAKLMLPIGGFFISIFTGWYLDKKLVIAEITNDGQLRVHVVKCIIFILKYVAPICIFCIFMNELGLF
jgi:NSS family neurotransmitter:Na+ symporter